MTWKVWEKYEVRDGWLAATGNLYKEYNVEEEKDIATHFAKVVRQESKRKKTTEKEIESLIKFMGNFGPLGQTINRREPEKAIDERGRQFLFDGDLLGWALDHATFVDITLQLAYLIKKPSETIYNDKLLNLLLSIKQKQQFHNGVLKIPTLLNYENKKFDFGDVKSNPIKVAKNIIGEVLGLNLGNAKITIKEEKHQIELTSLIQWIYNEIARNYASQQLKQCIVCGSIFFADHDKREYCPPLTKGESPCARRKRIRDFRKSKKGE